jgi:hypothetical protein
MNPQTGIRVEVPLEEPVEPVVTGSYVSLGMNALGELVILGVRHDRLVVVLVGPGCHGYGDTILADEFG